MEAPTEEIRKAWWYYTVEAGDGSIIQGVYPDEHLFPPRMMQRRVDLRGARCLDVCSAEGILPVLAKKGGAEMVVASDFDEEYRVKMQYLERIHNVELEFATIGRATNIAELIDAYPGGFDYINLSGLLYHVTSPIDTLMETRKLLRPNGLMLVSTIYLPIEECLMKFNDHGRFQAHWNVFWYMSVGYLDYMLRLCRLQPVDVLFMGDDTAGYASVLCRAESGEVVKTGDPLMDDALSHSLEFGQFRAALARTMPPSAIATKAPSSPVRLTDFLPNPSTVVRQGLQDTRLLRLDDMD